MFSRLDGSPVELPYIDKLSPRFRLAIFLEWTTDDAERIHQVAAAVLSVNGFSPQWIRILREFDGVELTKPVEFWREFGRVESGQRRGYAENHVLAAIVNQWARDPAGSVDRLKLRQLAALTLFENGFTTTLIGDVLGWQARGSVSRAMQSARDELQTLFDFN